MHSKICWIVNSEKGMEWKSKEVEDGVLLCTSQGHGLFIVVFRLINSFEEVNQIYLIGSGFYLFQML